jgi:UDP-3-O-[3-hydroxymyristoyl] glucosamine N-acyltransferase
MTRTLAEIAQLVQGTLSGDGQQPIDDATTLSDARPGCITFIDHANRLEALAHSAATAVFVPRGLSGVSLPTIEVEDVHIAMATLIQHLRPKAPRARRGISPQACLGSNVQLAEDVEVHAGATIDEDVSIGSGTTIHSGARIASGCRIGADVTIFANAVLYEGTRVGDRSIIHATAVLGAYGFGYQTRDGRHILSAQLGHVEIGPDVEVGAGTTIDRGTYGATVIGEGTKIDNQVMIGHNCRLGRHNMICSQVGIAGSTSTGDYVVMGGQAGIRDHVHIGRGAILTAMAGITNDVPDGVCMMGVPASPIREQKLKFAALSKLPQMRKEFKKLRATVQRTEESLQRTEEAVQRIQQVSPHSGNEDAPPSPSAAA